MKSLHATAGKPSKLRDSCHACALSKVKCHKEKPSCSRCAKRSITCEYFATKRPGRKRETNQAISNHSSGDTDNLVQPALSSASISLWPGNIVASSSIHGTSSASYNNVPWTNAVTPPSDLIPTSHRVSNASASYASDFPLSDIFNMPFESSPASALAGMGNDLGDFFTSPGDLFELQWPDSNFTKGRNDVAKIFLPEDVNPNPALKTSSVNHTNASSSNGQALSANDTRLDGTSDSTCRCLMQTLDFMKKLPNTKNNDSVSTQTVIMENKQTIEAVINILQCSCAEDSYLLTMLSMVVFQILGRYAAAARQRSEGAMGGVEKPGDSTKEQMRQLGIYDDESSWQISAQLILSGLHRVQHLVDKLSPELKTRGGGEASKGGENMGAKNEQENCMFSSFLNCEAPLSATTLDQIGIDLKKSLANLSSEVTDMLRQSSQTTQVPIMLVIPVVPNKGLFGRFSP